jgi:hypothetical protein
VVDIEEGDLDRGQDGEKPGDLPVLGRSGMVIVFVLV